jgi:hypothetical protein
MEKIPLKCHHLSKNLWTIPSIHQIAGEKRSAVSTLRWHCKARLFQGRNQGAVDIHGFQREDPGKTINGDVMGISSENHL